MAVGQTPSSDSPVTPGESGSPPFDPTVAHQARMYDYVLGGKDNYAADREAMEAILRVYPQAAFTARANRAFLGRAVSYLVAEGGVRQFLDIGTGIPTAGNTHEVAQAIAPETRVAYVDYDPLVLAYAEALLASSRQGAVGYVHADLRDTSAVLDRASQLLDFTQPVAITMLAILNAIGDADHPYAIVARLLEAVPSGSYLAISHGGSDLLTRETLDGLANVSDSRMRQQVVYRTREQVERFFDGLDLVEPGLVRIEEWRPEPGVIEANKSAGWCAVGRKR